METIPSPVWIAAVAHHLQLHWHTVDPRELEATARELQFNEGLRELAPADAVARWLAPACISPAAAPSLTPIDKRWDRFSRPGDVPF